MFAFFKAISYILYKVFDYIQQRKQWEAKRPENLVEILISLPWRFHKLKMVETIEHFREINHINFSAGLALCVSILDI